MKKKAFTLIELVVTLVIAAIILIPVSTVVVQSISNTFLPEYYGIASGLLEGKIEEVTNLRFEDVASEGPTAFGGNFTDYSYEIVVNYVDEGDLNTPVDPVQTDYKMVEVKISRTGFPDVTAVTLASNS